MGRLCKHCCNSDRGAILLMGDTITTITEQNINRLFGPSYHYVPNFTWGASLPYKEGEAILRLNQSGDVFGNLGEVGRQIHIMAYEYKLKGCSSRLYLIVGCQTADQIRVDASG